MPFRFARSARHLALAEYRRSFKVFIILGGTRPNRPLNVPLSEIAEVEKRIGRLYASRPK